MSEQLNTKEARMIKVNKQHLEIVDEVYAEIFQRLDSKLLWAVAKHILPESEYDAFRDEKFAITKRLVERRNEILGVEDEK